MHHLLRSTAIFAAVAVPLSMAAALLMNDENAASFDAIILSFLMYVIASTGAFLILPPNSSMQGLVSLLCAMIGGIVGFALNVDTDNDLDIDMDELTAAVKKLTQQIDLDGDGSIEMGEISLILLCGCCTLAVSTLLRELTRRHLQKQFF